MFNFSYGLDEDPTAMQLRLLQEMNPNLPRPGQPIKPIDEFEWGVAQSQLGTPQPGFDFSRMDTSKAYDRDIGDPERFTPVTNTTAGGGDPGLAREMAPNAPQTLQPSFGRIGQAFLQDEGGILEQVRRMRPDAYQGLLQQGPKSPLGNQIAGRAAARSPTGETPEQPAAAGVNVSGANGADRSNVPQPPEARDQTQAANAGTRPFSSTGTPMERPGSGFMDKLAENSDLLMGLGAGLMRGKNWSEGLSMGLEGAQKGAALGAATKAQQAKAMQQQLMLQGNAQFLMQRYGLSAPQALAMAGNTSVVSEAFKQANPEQYQTVVRNGQRFRVGPGGKEEFISTDPKEEETFRDPTPEETAQKGWKPGQWQVSEKTNKGYRLGAPVLSPEEQARAKELEAQTEAKTGRLTNIYKDRDKSQVDLFTAERLQDLLNTTDTGAKTRILEDIRTGTKGLISLDPNTDRVQAINQLTERLANSMHVPGTGPQSDRDLSSFLKQVPQLVNDPKGNQLIMQVLGGMAQRRKDAGDIADLYLHNKLSEEQANERLKNLPNPFDQWREQYQGGGTEAPKEGLIPNVPVLKSPDDLKNVPIGGLYYRPGETRPRRRTA